MRRILIAGVSVLALAGAGPATATAAQKKKPTLAVTSVKSHHGARIGPAERFRITGTLRNRSRGATQALLAAGLRTSAGRTIFVLGAKNFQRVKGRSSRKFTITATGPLLPAGSASRRFVLVACVRPRRGARASCRRTKRPVLVVAPATGTGTGNGTGNPGSGGTPPTTGGPGGATFSAGARSVGDRLFPQIGNGGYDVTHYDLVLAYDPATDLLQGTATIEARATKNLSEFSFDLHNMPASDVLVDGRKAGFGQPPGKLVVTPQSGIPAGTTFTTTVTYASPIVPYTDPDGSREGWVPTSDGAFVVNEPVGSMSWFPNNNVPTDKATYDLRVTVPGSLEVIGNGLLVSNTVAPDGKRTWHWREDSPMATYLVTATNGQFDVTNDTSNAQRPTWYALDSSYTPVQKTAMMSRLSRTPGIIDFFADFLAAPYPFSSAGGIVDRSNVGYALETQSKPNYAVNLQVDPASPGEDTISHELAHQWFGDSVSPATWSDIWLNEGPAEFFSWLWQERASGTPGPTTEQRFDTNYNSPAMSWSTPPAAPPTAADMFDTDAMYTRGAMVIEALRQIMGEEKFKAVLSKYLTTRAYGNASTQQFIDLIKSDSGKDPAKLDVFFREWLYGTTKPGITPDNFETYTAP
jgi:aminopeptidase N